MEEASLDQGSDHLPRLLIAAFFFLPPFTASATTFGPISVGNQVEHSDYIVHGRIVGSPWVLEEKNSRRPYTYWKVQVIDQPKGEPLGAEVDIRQPGGEIGEMGYHVAGSAKFAEGEDTFVVLRDTDEVAKEVVALSSGKYTVANGKVTSGIGFEMKDPQGRPYTAEAFSALVRRLASGKATREDKSVFVNKAPAHEDDPELARMEADAKANLSKPLDLPVISQEPPKPKIDETLIQESPIPAEEHNSSSAWWMVGGAALFFGFLAGIFLFLKR